MLNHILSSDAQAILLLCASFGQNRNIEPEPLTLSEYNKLTKILIENQLRPGDLLNAKGLEILPKINDKKLNYERLMALLERGGMLAIAVEKWVNQGLWIITRSDRNYPRKLKDNLKYSAPAIIYGVGNIELLEEGGLAIVGSRDINEEEIEYTKKIGKVCGTQEINVISGGAKGVDREAMLATLEAGGTTVGVLADSLNKASVSGRYRNSIRAGKLTLISAFDPNARFTIGNAMCRNKYIYALSDYALVVSSSLGKGGTWTGATEVLDKYQKIPVFVKMQGRVKEGNKALLDKGARSFPTEPWNSDLKQFLSFHKPLETVNYEDQLNLKFSQTKKISDSQTQANTSIDITQSKLEDKSLREAASKSQKNSLASETLTNTSTDISQSKNLLASETLTNTSIDITQSKIEDKSLRESASKSQKNSLASETLTNTSTDISQSKNLLASETLTNTSIDITQSKLEDKSLREAASKSQKNPLASETLTNTSTDITQSKLKDKSLREAASKSQKNSLASETLTNTSTDITQSKLKDKSLREAASKSQKNSLASETLTNTSTDISQSKNLLDFQTQANTSIDITQSKLEDKSLRESASKSQKNSLASETLTNTSTDISQSKNLLASETLTNTSIDITQSKLEDKSLREAASKSQKNSLASETLTNTSTDITQSKLKDKSLREAASKSQKNSLASETLTNTSIDITQSKLEDKSLREAASKSQKNPLASETLTNTSTDISQSKNLLDFQTQANTSIDITQSKLEDKSLREAASKSQKNPLASETLTNTSTDISQSKNLLDFQTQANTSIDITQSKLEDKSTQSQNIYEIVLPIILEKLTQPHNEKYLSKILKVRVGQLRHWLNQACAAEKIIKTKKTVNYKIAAETQQHQNHQISTQQLNIYEAVLPIILENLEKPQTDKDLATKLNVNISQLQDWLKIAKTEGKIISENQPNIYVINTKIKQLSLFDTLEDDEQGLDW